MKTSTVLILAGAGAAILVLYTRSKSSTPASLFGAPSAATAAVGGLFSGLGSSLGKLFSSGPSSPTSVNTTQSVASSPISTGSDGGFAVSDSEIGNISSYDAQSGAVGIYGIDYGE